MATKKSKPLLSEVQRQMRKRWANPVHSQRYGEVDKVIMQRFVEEFPHADLSEAYRQKLEKEGYTQC